ncbi:MAG: AccI family restriction endonuclease [Dehalococcoidia bacterium]|nr:AccI family restriction endonuclease [Dehalococcoidia bacterium]
MNDTYTETIQRLISESPFEIDTELQITGRIPTLATSAFLTNKQQGDWAEEIVCNAINEYSQEYRALKYGRDDSLDAGDPGFREFYAAYQDELNSVGKKPDILIFHRSDVASESIHDLEDTEFVQSAIAAIEVRSSSFLATRYSDFMSERTHRAEAECAHIQRAILQEPYADLLREKRPHLYKIISEASIDTFREFDFVARGWYSSQTLRELSQYLKDLKEQTKILQRRDYLSITPKLEDISVVNRWIQNFGVPHYYLQVFFDKGYIIPLKDILELTADSRNEDVIFSVERNVKNQGKTTINMNIQVGREVIRRIDMPEHQSAVKEQQRGRLLFYVTFQGGKGYLDPEVFSQEVANG